jgi:hypothetical protein
LLKLVALALVLLPNFFAQDLPKAPPSEWGSKTFEVKYVDPEQLRDIFSGRSFVMEANRDLMSLTAHGPPAFLKEVEAAVKQFDVPPLPPENIQITVYLLAVAAQAPAGRALPRDFAVIVKDLAAGGSQVVRLADSQMMRIRAGGPGEAVGLASAPDSASLSRIRIQSASITPAPKGEMISLNGLRIWLSVPSAPDTTKPSGTNPDRTNQDKTDADISVNIDVNQNQPVVVSNAGTDKPVVVVVRAGVVH